MNWLVSLPADDQDAVHALGLLDALLALSILGWRRALLVALLVASAWAAITLQQAPRVQPPQFSPDREVPHER